MRQRGGRSAFWALLMVSAAAWSGCAAAAVSAPDGSASGARAARKEAVTVLLNYFGLEGRGIEQELVGCVGDRLRVRHPDLAVVSPDEFRRTAFPDLAPDAAPRHPRYLGMLLDNPVFRSRLAAIKLRYLVAVGGATDVKTKGGAEFVGGYGFALLAGGWVWDRKTELTATIFDLKQLRPGEEISASSQGTAWLVMALPLLPPVGAPSFTESNACSALGDKLADFILTSQGGPDDR